MQLVVYLHRPDGTVTRLGSRQTDDARPHCLVNIAHAQSVTRSSRVVVQPEHRLVVAVEDPVGHFEPLYQHAGPAVRHALCYAAERWQSPRTGPGRREVFQGQFDGLALALEIMLNSGDTEVEPGIAWPDLLPPGAVEHTRRLLGTLNNANWLLGAPIE